MGTSVAEELRRDLACEDLLECVHGLTDLDRTCFRTVAKAQDPLTVDEIAERVDRERSTAYRSVHRLLDAGFLEKDQVNYDHGGYYHVYRPVDPDEVAEDMAELIDRWHAKMTDLVTEFREEYGEQIPTDPMPD
ncbi:MAG: helix-turn-helix domain-containing protein [Halobacteriales archaeon]